MKLSQNDRRYLEAEGYTLLRVLFFCAAAIGIGRWLWHLL